MKRDARLLESHADGGLLLLERHLAGLAGLRCEFSLKLVDGVMSSRRKPLFWVGVSHRDSREKFHRIRAALEDLHCPHEVLKQHAEHLDASIYQGIGLDMNTAEPAGTLFMHCRNAERIGLGWRGKEWQQTRYAAGGLADETHRHQLESIVHPHQRASLSALLMDRAVIHKGGYWLQLRNGNITEAYITLPWHPTLEAVRCVPAKGGYDLPKAPDRYVDANIRHIGFSLKHETIPALTFYISSPLSSTWPRDLDQLENAVMATASATISAAVFATDQ